MSRGKKIGITVLIVSAILVLLTLFTVKLINDLFTDIGNTLSEILPTGIEDEDIIDYIKAEHDFDIEVINNQGPLHPKTGHGGVANVVSEENAIEFDVFISSFGNIKGDNYLFIKNLPEMKKEISEDVKKLENEQLQFVSVDVDEENSTFKLSVTIPESISYEDQEFLQLIDKTLTVVLERNKQLQKEYNVDISRVYFDFDPEDDALGELIRISYQFQNLYHSLEDLQNELIRQNSKTIFSLFESKDLEELKVIEGELPWLYTLESNPLKCLEFNGFTSCDSYAVSLEFSDDQAYDDFVEHRYDNPETIEMVFNTIQLLQATNLPIDQFIGPNLFLPKDLSLQATSEKELLKQDPNNEFGYLKIDITDIKEIKTKEDIMFE